MSTDIDARPLGGSTLGERIRHIRKKVLRMGQQELAEKLGLSRYSTISDYERDEITPPDERLEAIAELVGAPEEELFGDVRRTPADENGGLPPPSASEFWQRLDAIEASSLSEVQKVYKIDALAAAIRAQAQERDAAAAEGRARAMLLEIEASRERTAAIDRNENLVPVPRPEDSAQKKTA